MTETKTETMHKHFTMGHGRYRLVGIWSAPSKAILEQNPSAYNLMMDSRPVCCNFNCDHCGTHIMHHFIIRDENGEDFSVGSSCIEKLGQHELVTAAQKLEKERQRQLRKERNKKKEEARKLAYEAKVEAQRAKNNGLTDHEVFEAKRAELYRKTSIMISELASPITDKLEAAGGHFCKSIIFDILLGNIPSGRGETITIEIMAKQQSNSRKGSKAYDAAYPEMEELFHTITQKITKLKNEYDEFVIQGY